MANSIGSSLLWVAAASVLGMAISAVFAGWLQLSRRRFLVPYVFFVCVFLAAFILQNNIRLGEMLTSQWGWGILAGGLVSVFLVRSVRSQAFTRQSNGTELVIDLAWAGLVYGVMDALFLNVMPVVAVWMGFNQVAWAASVWGKIAVGAIALAASLLVTLTYHLGYPEFRSKRVVLVLVGNSLITLAFLLSGSPLGALISHTLMHIAAVLQGAETTIQLPPHYPARAHQS